ncbi:cytochrome-c peroxidase [Bradyrhizobium sp.]|uniref:cytochrome-c peroxidase n=1 Tax=Bradyrhizobium sp. TaxID=376 RepID=UPI0025BD575A|nr:cytochrome c peroxidase [Bradyrhizobium sp.]
MQSAPAAAQAKIVAEDEPITPVPEPPAADPLKLALGARLFGDVRLSTAGNLACASCHDIRSNGAGGIRTQPGNAMPVYDTLTVFNAALSFRLGWQGSFRNLAEHVEASLENPANMNTNAEAAVRRLQKDPDVTSRFRAAYGRDLDRDAFLDALVTFERSLLTPGARFDRWLGGDTSALSPGELEGYRTFKSLGCSACHQGVNVGGNLFERQGIFRPLVVGPPRIVRVPSLRNVAATAPYFHDGSAATLEDAVRRMAAAQLDRTLSDQQVASLVLFLKTLTGNYRGAPVVGAAP